MKRCAWCLAVVVQSGAIGLSVAADRPKSANDVTNSDKVVLVGHRGASHAAPENTLPAFRLAFEEGADFIEGDFWLSRDEQIVCLHDDDTAR